MGMFSWDCTRCHRSIRSRLSAGHADQWMTDAVAVLPDGTRVTGSYDGYGYLDSDVEVDLTELTGVELRHAACDEVAGSPPYQGPSRDAADQGHFIDPADNPPDPRRTGK